MVPNSRNRFVGFLGGFFLALLVGESAWADPPAAPRENPAPPLTLEQAVAWAVKNNPDLAVFRAQRGIAEAGVVIARTYPFNPIWTSTVMGDGGPASAGITNRVFNQHTFTQEVEVRGQCKIRREVAAAVLSRTEWEIATQEQLIAVRTVRAFFTYLYRQEKLRLLEEMIRQMEQTSEKVKRLVDQGKLRTADLLLARSDEMEVRSQRGSRETLAVTAWHDLRRLLGVQKEILEVHGRLPAAAPEGGAERWAPLALEKRADLQALTMAYQEAEQRERLEVANRFGNPVIGSKVEYNETRVDFIGGTLSFSVPFFNTRRGEIHQRQAEKSRVLADKQRLEIQINQDVLAARDRLQAARNWTSSFETDVLPALRKTMEGFDQLFAQGEPSVDVLRLIDVQRRYLRARDSYLDAQWELSQARADLAAAVGDFLVAAEDSCLAPAQPSAEKAVPNPSPRQ